MAARHLVAFRDFAELRDVDLYDFVYAGAEVFAVLFAREAFNLDDLAAFAVRDAQRRVADFAGLFAEYRAQKLFFRRLVGFALRRDLSYEYVAGLDLGSDAHDAVLVEVFQRVFADVRDVARNLFGAELRVARFDLVFLDMY